MRIDLHCDGVETAPACATTWRSGCASIGRFRDHIQWARVKVADVNGGGRRRQALRGSTAPAQPPRCGFAIAQLDVRAAVDRPPTGSPACSPARAPPPARAGDGRDPGMIFLVVPAATPVVRPFGAGSKTNRRSHWRTSTMENRIGTLGGPKPRSCRPTRSSATPTCCCRSRWPSRR